MYESETDTDDTKLSRLNSGGLINLRLHRLCEDANRHSRKGQYASWNADLDRIWCEIAGDEKEDSESYKKFDTINNELNLISPIINWKSSGFQDILEGERGKQQQQYLALIKKELFLKRTMNKQGKGTAYIDEEDDWE